MRAKVIPEQAIRVGTGDPNLCNGDAPIYNLLRSFSVPERGVEEGGQQQRHSA